MDKEGDEGRRREGRRSGWVDEVREGWVGGGGSKAAVEVRGMGTVEGRVLQVESRLVVRKVDGETLTVGGKRRR